jgi:hypothetical protein
MSSKNYETTQGANVDIIFRFRYSREYFYSNIFDQWSSSVKNYQASHSACRHGIETGLEYDGRSVHDTDGGVWDKIELWETVPEWIAVTVFIREYVDQL